MRGLGEDKERIACGYLEQRGLRLLARNYRCRRGEIDLVMLDETLGAPDLVFIEVRFRGSERFGGAAASVDRRKQARLSAAAAHYLQHHPSELPCRFDVVAIGAGDRVHWIRGAFDEV